ncbi:MAG TPA: CDP-alcohol phosphatidyltransferase family protein [Polyangiaceae bacterium]|nr:CDP-alcohol phosphatidyltransferase family protein [Polyangiaceae bacterium]
MGAYRAKDLLLWPNLVSFTRLPLAYAFVEHVRETSTALVILAVSGFTDVLDGFLARRLGMATPTGAVVDGVTDKIFALTVLVTLIARAQLSPLSALLLGTREFGELPLVVWWALHRERRRAKAEDPRANWLGKAVTVLQFACVALVLSSNRFALVLIATTAVLGVGAAVSYWRRELADSRG